MKSILTLLTIPAILFTAQTPACETCALYSPPGRSFLLQQPSDESFKLNLFTRYATLDNRLDGRHEMDNHGEEIESFIHQLSLGYVVSPKLKAQLSLPYLRRDFTFRDGDHLHHDDESGFGDLSVIGRYTLHESKRENGSLSVSLIGGLKTPTGDSDRLRSRHDHAEANTHMEEGHEEAAHEVEASHDASAISGHDVTLGSGSWDLIGGIKTEFSQNDWILDGMVQYYWRTEGDHDYTFADDLYLSAHAGRIVYRQQNTAIGLRVGILGELRDADTQGGIALQHTQLDAWYADLTATLAHGAFLGEAGVDLPLEQDSGATTLVPDARLRLSVGFFF
ncbi:MAG: hypothetical protein ACI97B_004270 [Verrucomicrobiales bacterium]|jgi:hypothetical protein